VGKKIRVLTTAADVVHSWWVPAFGAKQDAIPGFIRDLWFRADTTGTFRSQCVELCGKEHGFMPIVVQVVSAEDYTKWVATKKKEMLAAADDPAKTWSADELKKRGEDVYAKNCVACHQANGKGTPPAFPPLDGSKVATGPKEAHMDTVLNGRPGTAMAAFKQQLNDTDIAAVVTYERNSWSNKAGLVQPAEVKARRK
jgi:cytochrome c oxidase subunit 2